jgi:hypothetical protein
MVSGFYDIFKRNERGIPVWVETAKDPDSAKARIIELCQTSPGQYLVFHSRTGRMITTGTLVSSSEHRALERKRKDSGETLIG